MKDSTTIAHFGVLDASGTVALDTLVEHHYDTVNGYELFTITQTNEDGSHDTVSLSREQLASLVLQAKGH